MKGLRIMDYYQPTREIHFLEGKPYCSYGIRCAAMQIHDVTLSQSEIELLVSLCNQMKVAPCHLRDIVEDFLSGGNELWCAAEKPVFAPVRPFPSFHSLPVPNAV